MENRQTEALAVVGFSDYPFVPKGKDLILSATSGPYLHFFF